MKKFVAMTLAVMTLTATAAAASADSLPSVSIQQIYSDKADYWDGEYEAHGRRISFHAPVYVPDAKKAPVLTVTSNTLEDMTIPEPLVLWENEPNSQSFGKAEVLKESYWTSKYFHFPWSEAGARDAETCYAQDNEYSLADAIRGMQSIVDDVWRESSYGVMPYDVQILTPYRFKRTGEYKDFSDMPGWERYTGKGVYILDSFLTIRGIPVFMGAGYGLKAPNGGNGYYSTLSSPAMLSIGHYLEPGNYYVAMASCIFKETGEIVEDIPLCPFEDIKREVERLIEQGNIRNVFSARLGYVVFQKADEKYDYKNHTWEIAGAEYVAVPTWVIECTYAQNAKKEIMTNPKDPEEDTNTEEIPYYGAYGFQNLMINAQTGKAYDPYATQSSKQAYLKALKAPKVIKW